MTARILLHRLRFHLRARFADIEFRQSCVVADIFGGEFRVKVPSKSRLSSWMPA